MKILHTEASTGFGGQELRILKESEGMRDRGHEIVMAVAQGSQLAVRAREAGFVVYELPFHRKRYGTLLIWRLIRLVKRHRIELINTHSSWDAWMGGIVARLMDCSIIRTRHVSTPTRSGLNSRLLFSTFADAVVTTCDETAQTIRKQACLLPTHCRSIPTGIDVHNLKVHPEERRAFRHRYGFTEKTIVAGTVCILRHWKGVIDMIEAAKRLHNHPELRWLIVGDGPSRCCFEDYSKRLGMEDRIVFTGYLQDPKVALASLDLFLLLSTAHEGVSQACLQASYYGCPLITTPTGGLSEVCLDGVNGFLVPIHSPDLVAHRVQLLADDPLLRANFGKQAKQLVNHSFTLKHTLDAMESIYAIVRKG